MDARIVKTCSMGLKEMHLGKTISEMQGNFRTFTKGFGFNICGEGGEYETAVFDCPLFKTQRIVCTD
jgi:diphthine-ammonia ligase